MCSGLKLITVIFLGLLFFLVEPKKPADPYKVLGVDRNASQRDVQKAFHKLSLKYHPDKNKNKGAQAKFEEINNAYEILSDDQKRKNYDLYGDESGGPTFDGGNSGANDGYTYFTSGGAGGGAGQSRFSYRPDEWQNTGGQGSKSFSFSFGGSGGGSPFGFGFNDIFSNLFGGDVGGGSHSGGSSGANFGGSRSSTGSQFRQKSSSKTIRSVNSQVYETEIKDKGTTWLLLSYTPSLLTQQYESIMEEIADSLKGALKVGKLNCERDPSFCKSHGIYPHRDARIFVYSYITSESGSFVEYNGDFDVKSLKSFCQEHLPRFSKRIRLDNFEPSFGAGERLPRVMLLSTKKDTPIIWRTLSGLFRKRFIFYDAQVVDVSDAKVRKLGVTSLPAIVGWLSNGEKQVLEAGISVKDLESAVQELSLLLEGFEKKNKKIVSSQSKKSESEPSIKLIQQLTASNLNSVCGEQTPVCLIGAFRSSKTREKIESILTTVSQKSLSRRRSLSSSDSKDSISYALLDATKQQTFLNALDSSGFKSSNGFLVAYKPRKGKYAAFTGNLSVEEAEKFVSSVLNGDVQFNKVRQKPVIK